MLMGLSRLAKIQLFGLISLFAAWQSYQFALSVNLRVSDPELALQRDPDDAIALAKVVKNKSREAEEYVSDAADTSRAIQSLIGNPLSRSSLRIIGMNESSAGDAQKAFAAMSLASKVSRRDTTAQVWLLERAAADNDFEAILRHYDAAMSVTPELGPVLQPVMVDALQYQDVRDAMVGYVNRQARWMPGFLNLASREAALEDVIDLTAPIAVALSGEEYEKSIARIIYRAAQDGDWEGAMDYAEAVWADFDAGAFSESAPNKTTLDKRLGLLAWELFEDNGIQASLDMNGGVQVTIRPLARGTVVRRHIPVKGGQTYTLTQRVNFDGASGARLAWRGDCVTTTASSRVWEQTLPSAARMTTYRSSLNIPEDCSILALSLEGNGADGQQNVYAKFDEISFES